MLGDQCACHCCTSLGCSTSRVGSFFTWNCENRSCTRQLCIDKFHERCPPADAPGVTEARCSGTRQFMSSLLIGLGILSAILMMKKD